MAKSKLGVGMLIGAAAGAVAGLLMSEKPGNKLRKQASVRATELQKLLKEHKVDEKVREIFGTVDSRSRAIFKQAKKDMISQLEQLDTSWRSIDKARYGKLVSNVYNGLKKDKSIPDDEVIKRLHVYLEDDFNKLKRAVSPPKKTTAKRRTS